MQLTNLINLLTVATAPAMLAKGVAAVPKFSTLNERDVSTTEPDLRFSNLSLSHPLAEVHVERADVYGFYECDKTNFKGTCAWTQIQPGEKVCYNRRYGPLGSIGPDKGVQCEVFSHLNCDKGGDHKTGFTYPGSDDCPNDKFLKTSASTECPVSWRCDVG